MCIRASLLPGMAPAATMSGVVQTVGGPVPAAHVRLYQAGGAPGAGNVQLGTGFANSAGESPVSLAPPGDPNPALHLPPISL